MCVNRLLPHHVVAEGIWRTAGFKAGDRGEVGLGLLRAGPGRIAGNSGAPIPVDPCPLLESGEITIDRIFRICMQVVGGRELTV